MNMDEVARLRKQFTALSEQYHKALLEVEAAQRESERLDREMRKVHAKLQETRSKPD